MKTLFFFLLLTLQTLADGVTLTWDASPAADNVVKYNVYEKTATGPVKVGSVNAPAVTFTIDPAATTAKVYVVRAANAIGLESGPSNEVTIPAPPGAPKNLRVITIQVSVQ